MGQRCTGRREKHALTRGGEQGRCRSTSTATPLLEDESYWIIGHETPLRASIAAILPSLFANFFVFFFFLEERDSRRYFALPRDLNMT